ncbi:MAG: hypothetical protein IT210_00425 [Armatimonadetes bacterium]|nr:hypothetical protein [Armatimonadota bacterium]
MPWFLSFVLVAAILLAPAARAQQPDSTVPAINDLPDGAVVGERPYEMVWADRREARPPLVNFENLTGWRAEMYSGAVASFARSREQQIWGQYVGKLTYRGTSADSRIILRPPQPVPIAGAFDCIDFWCYGNNWDWVPDPSTPKVNLFIHLTDAKGQKLRIPITNVRWEEWWLVRRRLPADTLRTIAFPCDFDGLEISGGSNKEDRRLYFDSISFYTEEMKPLTFEPRPKRNLELFPGQTAGLNTGPGTLPFPTREETILPSNFQKSYKNAVVEAEPGVYIFTYRGRDADIAYRFAPQEGFFGLTVLSKGQKISRPMEGAGVRFEKEAGKTKLISAALKDRALTARYDVGGHEVAYTFRIWQKSLVIDAVARGGEAVDFSFGQITEASNPKLVLIPYLTYGGSNPRALCSGPAEEPVFTSIWLDWYRSNGSEPYSNEGIVQGAARINGGVRYNPKTDGSRNELFERIFLTVSPIFEETLPTIPNPPSPWGKEAGRHLWQESWGPADYDKERQRSKMLRSYGIEKLIQCNHEITWRDGGESFTLRTRSAPKRGGDEALKRFVAAQKSLGWRSGLYTNYTDFAPVNEYWDPDRVQRASDNEWRAAWPRNYAFKPSRAVEFDAKLAPVVKEKFDSDSAYTDVHTAVSPWGYCDYDARVPGAGTFAATFYAYGELLLNDQKVYDGPIFSEGTYQWLYAGLASGNYGLAYTGVDLSEEPLNVAFDLLKIHTLESDIGMPWTGGFFKKPGWDRPENIDASIDRFIAATLAYGHIGWLVEEQYDMRRTCRSYYMILPVTRRYAMEPPLKIEYAGPSGNWITPSQAIASDALRDSRLHVIYPKGLELYINWDKQTNWTVVTPERQVVLPPNGWCAFDDRGFFEASSLEDGQRVDMVVSPEYAYLDGRGRYAQSPLLAATGGVAMKPVDDEHREIIDIGGNREIGFKAGPGAACVAYDAEGKPLGDVPLRPSDRGYTWFTCVPQARSYKVAIPKPVKGADSPSLSLAARSAAVPGDILLATLRLHAPRRKAMEVVSATLGFEGQETPAAVLANVRLGPGKSLEHPEKIAIPASLSPGSRAWLRADIACRIGEGSKEETLWFDVNLVPAAEIALEPARYKDGSWHAEAKIANNIFGAPAARLQVEPGAGWEAAPAEISLIAGSEQEAPFALKRTGAVAAGESPLTLTYTSGSLSAHFPYRIKTDLVRPVIVDLGSGTTRFTWGCAFRGQPEQPADSSTGAAFHPNTMLSGGVERRGLFAHPPYQGGVGYVFARFGPIRLPEQPAALRLYIGLMDGGDRSDGVDFSATVTPKGGQPTALFKVNWDRREWREVSADMSAYAGQEITLTLTADVGPNDNSSADWACWGEPRIEQKSESALVTLVPGSS